MHKHKCTNNTSIGNWHTYRRTLAWCDKPGSEPAPLALTIVFFFHSCVVFCRFFSVYRFIFLLFADITLRLCFSHHHTSTSFPYHFDCVSVVCVSRTLAHCSVSLVAICTQTYSIVVGFWARAHDTAFACIHLYKVTWSLGCRKDNLERERKRAQCKAIQHT